MTILKEYSIYILLLAILLLIGAFINVSEDRDYFQRTTYDPKRFAEAAPLMRDLMKDVGSTMEAEAMYVSLFHNGIEWLNDGIHPPLVNEVFFWATDNMSLSEIPTQNIPIDSIPKIYDILKGECIIISTNSRGNIVDADLRCPVVNQRNEVVGFFGVYKKDADINGVGRDLSILSLYRSNVSSILFSN